MADEEKHKINNDLLPVFSKLKEYFDKYSNDILPDNSQMQAVFEMVLKATTVKAYEFSITTISLKGNNIFFMIPALRGICEEYIVEKFFFEKFTDAYERGRVMQIWAQHEVLKSSIAQWEYFKVNKSNQTLYYQDTFPNNLKEMESDMKNYFKKKFPGSNFKSPFPSVYYMAKETGLLELYNYLYHATSTFVHFHPLNLLRMGWGDSRHAKFSTFHFQHYYNYFSTFYSALLFCELCDWQIKNGYLDGLDGRIIKEIREILNRINRWPEIVTFEEMNINTLSRVMFFQSPDMAKS